jgi:glycosyltransferase involved in cell wall biosynthesis
MARALEDLLRDPKLRARMGRAAMSRARQFDIRRTVRRTEEVYEEILG